jgi:hypothetical protein
MSKKSSHKASNDPEAQMLGAMLAAQVLNADEKPVFGGYVVGRFWFFAVLEQNNYTLNKAYDITEEKNLQQIIFILKHLKKIIFS